MAAIQSYPDLKAIAKAQGVSQAAVSHWKRHPKWPIAGKGKLDKKRIDRFVAEWIAPHRKGPALAKAKPAKPQAAKPAPVPLVVLTSPKPEELPRTLEELEQKIKAADNPVTAQLLATQVRALKGLQEVMIRQGNLVSSAEVERGRLARIALVKGGLLNLPAQIASKLVGLVEEEIRAVLYGEMVKLCGEFARA